MPITDCAHETCIQNRREGLTIGEMVPRYSCAGEFIESIEKYQYAAAVLAQDRKPLSYGQLCAHITRTVALLNSFGLCRNDRVVVALPNGPELAVALISVLSGFTCVPLNNAYRKKEYDLCLSDINAKAVIVQSGTDSSVRTIAALRNIPVIELTPLNESEAGLFDVHFNGNIQKHSLQPGFAAPDDTALIMLTSGTTSRPKIIHWSQQKLFSSSHTVCRSFELTAADRCLNVMPLFHLHGLISCLLASLYCGGSVICTPGFDHSVFFRWIERYHPTWYSGVAAIHHAVLQLAERNPAEAERAGLRFIRHSSSPLPLSVMKRLETLFRAPVIEVYGMTEITPITISPMHAENRKPGSAGLTVGPDIAIMDDMGNILPPGEVGEIVICGEHVFENYGDTHGETHTFVKGWFRTGDLGYMDSDAYLYITERITEIINQGGQKISPCEIDETLLQHPFVREAAAFAVPHRSLGEALAVSVVADSDGKLSEKELRRFLTERLTLYKIPQQIVFVENIPKNEIGKVRRNELAHLFSHLLKPEYVPPATETEQIVAGIWREVLELDRIGIHDNLIGLGGDSIHATRIISRVNHMFSLQLTLQSMFELPTLYALSEVIDMARFTAAEIREEARRLPVDYGPGGRSFPLSFGQQSLWFLYQLQPDSPAYNISRALRIRGRLDTIALQQSIDGIIERHEILRTTFSRGIGDPVQMITPSTGFKIKLKDLENVPDGKKEEKARELAGEEALRPFNLETGPLLRAVLIKLEPEDHMLLLTVHHIAADGWSMGILFRELSQLYAAFSEGRTSPLPELPAQYTDFVLWQRKWLQGQRLNTQLEFWREHLRDMATLELPADRPRSAVQTFKGASHTLKVSKELTDALKRLSQRECATLFMPLLTAFQVLLHRYSGQDDIVVGAPVANRNRVDVEVLIGFFVNTLVLRTDTSGDPAFRELLRRVRKNFLDIYEHRDLPFEQLVKELKPERDLGRNPLFQIVFALHNVPFSSPELSNLAVEKVEGEDTITKFDLEVSLQENLEGLSGSFVYNRDLFDAATIERMAAHYQILLESIAAKPDQRLSELPILTGAERHQMLYEWNSTARNYPVDTCIHHVIEYQAAESPDAVAVVYEERHLNYGELNQRANHLAHYLMKHGVGPEVLVGMCMKRSLESVICIIGILKAGGAYVPFDASYPEERLLTILKDCNAPVVITAGGALNGLSSGQRHVICLEKDWNIIEREPGDNPDHKSTSRDLAYVIYTSGSTGTPKGVAIEHRQLTNYICGIQERLGFERKAHFAMVTTFTADLGNTMLFSALCTGGKLHIASREQALDPEAMGIFISSNSIDYLKIVPSHLQALLTAKHPGQLLPRKKLILGGEATHSDLVEQILALSPGCAIVNHYGPTETTIGVLTYQYRDPVVTKSGTLPVGRPLPNTVIYLLDKYLQPVPIGVAGEIYIGGACLARGYLNDPVLTKEKFIDNPFLDRASHSLLYKTGDRARYLADGNLEFLGRADAQMKVRGYRVEPSEIESALRQHSKVRDALVLQRVDAQGHNVLAAYVLPSRDASPSISGKKRYRLPNNLAVVHVNRHETDYIYSEIFERQAYLRHGIRIKKGDCVFDAGANIGLFALYVNIICGDVRIYSFEPNPDVFELLKANAELYGNNINVYNCGLADKEMRADFTFFPGYSLLSGFHADAKTEKETVKAFITNQYSAGSSELSEFLEQADSILEHRFTPDSFSANLRTLSNVIDEENVQGIDLLKINVERSELNVLRGIRDEHWKRIRQIVLEVDIKENLEIIRNMLERQGYHVVVQQEPFLKNTQLHYVYAKKHSEYGGWLSDSSDEPFVHEVQSLPEPFIIIDELRHYLKGKVPDFMIPSSFFVLEEFPLTRNGKVDVHALPSPSHDHRDQRDSSMAPQSSLEEKVLKIWRDILKHDAVGIHDDFFDLGGHSLLAIQLISWIRRDLHAELSVHDIFEYSTVAGLAAIISNRIT